MLIWLMMKSGKLMLNLMDSLSPDGLTLLHPPYRAADDDPTTDAADKNTQNDSEEK